MFYHVNTLRRGGRFHLCWVAGAWPERFRRNSPRSLRSYPLVRRTVELVAVVAAESESVNRRYALRLSSHLVHGLTVIYKTQLDLLIYDILNFEMIVKKHIEFLHKPQQTKRKLSQLYEHEQPVLDQIDLSAITKNTVANIADITMREETVMKIFMPDEGFGEEKDPLLEFLVPETLMEIDDLPIAPVAAPQDVQKIPEILVTSPSDKEMTVVNADVSKIKRKKKDFDENFDTSKTIELEQYRPVPRIAKRRCVNKLDEYIEISSATMRKYCTQNLVHLRCLTSFDDLVSIETITLPNVESLFTNLSLKRITPNHESISKPSKIESVFLKNCVTKPELTKEREIPAEKEREEMRAMANDKTSIAIETAIDRSTGMHQATLPHISIASDFLGASRSSARDKSIQIQTEDISIMKNVDDQLMTIDEYLDTSVIVPQPPALPTESLNDLDETMLGSLDRTPISLGDSSPSGSVKLSKDYLDEFWDPVNLFKEILIEKRNGVSPITLEDMINKRYDKTLPVSRVQIMCRAFYSLLRLKKHDIVEILKKPNTIEIGDIIIGKRAQELMRNTQF